MYSQFFRNNQTNWPNTGAPMIWTHLTFPAIRMMHLTKLSSLRRILISKVAISLIRCQHHRFISVTIAHIRMTMPALPCPWLKSHRTTIKKCQRPFSPINWPPIRAHRKIQKVAAWSIQCVAWKCVAAAIRHRIRHLVQWLTVNCQLHRPVCVWAVFNRCHRPLMKESKIQWPACRVHR